jgi:hypothetical protein
MTRYNGGTKVAGGYYLNLRTWGVAAVAGESGVLSDTGEYVHVPALAVLPAMLLLSFAFVVFLPAIGLALAAWALARKVAALSRTGAHTLASTVAPAWHPGMAWFSGHARSEKKAESPMPTGEALSELERDIAARRDDEER